MQQVSEDNVVSQINTLGKKLNDYQLTFGRGINNLFLKSFVMSLELEGFRPFRPPSSRLKDVWIHFRVIASLGAQSTKVNFMI
jgi:hypothetical protein